MERRLSTNFSFLHRRVAGKRVNVNRHAAAKVWPNYVRSTASARPQAHRPPCLRFRLRCLPRRRRGSGQGGGVSAQLAERIFSLFQARRYLRPLSTRRKKIHAEPLVRGGRRTRPPQSIRWRGSAKFAQGTSSNSPDTGSHIQCIPKRTAANAFIAKVCPQRPPRPSLVERSSSRQQTPPPITSSRGDYIWRGRFRSTSTMSSGRPRA